ncbi:MAG: substrate-binding domain-containing protein [Bauldia sp.]|nr:substrate-binding domain-containing protein [Bauldia sp.]
MRQPVLAAAVAGLITALPFVPADAAGEKVALLTPYLAAVATAEMVDSFKTEAGAMDWQVDVVDTAGDLPALASRVEDVVAAKVDAIVLFSIDPAQIQAQVDAAKAAGIPVVTIDGAKNDSTVLNVTSDNYVLGKTMTEFLFSQIGPDGKIVRFFHSAHPGVRQREIALDDALKTNPGITEVGNHYVQVPGQIEDSRAAMDAILLANPGEGAITGVWAAWDEPGIGAKLSIDAAGRNGIVIAGIDGNPQAIELIKGCTQYVGTVRQGFGEMSKIAAAELNKVLAGGSAAEAEMYAPVDLITRESLGVTCP